MPSGAFARLTLAALVTVAVIPVSVAPAHAGTIIDFGTVGCADAFCEPIQYDGGTLLLSSNGGDFTRKTLEDQTGLGISGRTTGEIDVDESIDGTFSSAVTVDALRLVFLYNGPEFGDPSEIARVSINGGQVVGRLTADGENTATWSLGGLVTSCDATAFDHTGCFLIQNPFGAASVWTISFGADSAGPGLPNDSDYSLGGMEVSSAPTIPAGNENAAPPLIQAADVPTDARLVVVALPEPAMLLLLGAGLAFLRPRLNRP